MRTQVTLLLLLLAVGLSQSRHTTNENDKMQCKSIETIPMCAGIGYSFTGLPNLRNQDDVNDINQELETYNALIESNCSTALVHLLCSVYAPLCYSITIKNVYTAHILRPCQNLCEYVDMGCRAVVEQQGYTWPPGPHLDCHNYPKYEDGLCFGPRDPSSIPPLKGHTTKGNNASS